MLAHGVDLVEVERIAQMTERHGERFLHRVFTADERAYAARGRGVGAEHLAARFAAKEAALKALGVGWAEGVAWTDVAVLRSDSGEPSLELGGRAAELARDRGLTRWRVSLSHAGGLAMASVIADGG